VGKTTLIRRILGKLPDWGALKTTRTHGHGDAASRYEIRNDRRVLGEAGSDTALFLEAGAARVGWLLYRPSGLAAGLTRALEDFHGLPGVVLEGNSYAGHLRPTGLIVVARPGLTEVKPSARPLIPLADWVVINRDRDATDEDASTLARDLSDRFDAKRLFVLDLADAMDGAGLSFLDEVRAWARRLS